MKFILEKNVDGKFSLIKVCDGSYQTVGTIKDCAMHIEDMINASGGAYPGLRHEIEKELKERGECTVNSIHSPDWLFPKNGVLK